MDGAMGKGDSLGLGELAVNCGGLFARAFC